MAVAVQKYGVFLRLELEDKPDHPFALFNLGMTYADMGEHRQAVDALRRSVEVSPPAESHVRKLYALLVSSITRMKDFDEAWRWCRKGRELFPKDPELLFREGMIAHERSDYDQAERSYQAVLVDPDERHFSSIDQGIVGYKSHHNLAILYTDWGRLTDAEHQWRRVIELVPAFRAGWRGLGDNLLQQGKLAEAQAWATRMDASEGLAVEAMMLRAALAKQKGDASRAKQLLEEAVAHDPQDHLPLSALCQLLFERCSPTEAEQALTSLADLDPDDGSALHNLATLYLRTGRHAEAASTYRESLRRRPDSATTHLHLGDALFESGQADEAASAWQTAAALQPDEPVAGEALRRINKLNEAASVHAKP